MNIQEFIADFVCDNQQTVDVSHMQENIHSYKRLEYEASILQERIDLLEQIIATYKSYSEAQSSELLYSFLIAQALAHMKGAELQKVVANAQTLAEKLQTLTLEIEAADKRLKELREQQVTLQTELKSNDNAQALERIDRQIAEKELKIRTLHSEYEKTSSTLGVIIAAWRQGMETMLHKIDTAQGDLLQKAISSRISDLNAEGRDFLARLKTLDQLDTQVITQLGETGLGELAGLANNLKTHSIELNVRLHDEQLFLARQRANLQVEQQSLESGIYRFPQDALDLKEAIISRLRIVAKGDVPVRIVAEAAEIKNPRWRNVIEGYLHTQKFYLLVPQEYFRDALRVFDAIKRSKAVYGTGIIDSEKLRRLNPVADQGSLAEEIETADDNARLFLNFILVLHPLNT